MRSLSRFASSVFPGAARLRSAWPRTTRLAPPCGVACPPPTARSCTTLMRHVTLDVLKTASSSPTVNPARAMRYDRSTVSRSRFRRAAASSLETSKRIEARRVWTVRPSEAAWRKRSPTTMPVVSPSCTVGVTSTARRQPSRALASVGSALGDHSTTTSSRPRRLIFRGVLTLTPATSTSRGGFASAAANLTT